MLNRMWGVAIVMPLALAGPVMAQMAISAKAGMVQVADGDVFLNGDALRMRAGEFPQLTQHDTLRCDEGRAEVLLTPGAFLRVGANSAIRMTSTRLTDVQLELVAGEAVIEAVELVDGNAITTSIGAARFEVTKGGVYSFQATPLRVRVYAGELACLNNTKNVTLKAGREMSLQGSEWKQARFDTKDTDEMYRWSSRRSQNIAVANVSAARQAGYGSYSGAGYTGLGFNIGYSPYSIGYSPYSNGIWAFNPYYGMYTYMPYYGLAYSPFGYAYYNPASVAYVYSNIPAPKAGTPQRGNVPGPGIPQRPGRGATPPSPSMTAVTTLRSTTAITRGPVVSRQPSFSYAASQNSSGRGSYTPSYSGTGTVSTGVAVAPAIRSAPMGSTGGVAAGSSSGGGRRAQ
jgi:hypothetical protein